MNALLKIKDTNLEIPVEILNRASIKVKNYNLFCSAIDEYNSSSIEEYTDLKIKILHKDDVQILLNLFNNSEEELNRGIYGPNLRHDINITYIDNNLKEIPNSPKVSLYNCIITNPQYYVESFKDIELDVTFEVSFQHMTISYENNNLQEFTNLFEEMMI